MSLDVVCHGGANAFSFLKTTAKVGKKTQLPGVLQHEKHQKNDLELEDDDFPQT